MEPITYVEDCDECDGKGVVPHTNVGGTEKIGMMPCFKCWGQSRPITPGFKVGDGTPLGTITKRQMRQRGPTGRGYYYLVGGEWHPEAALIHTTPTT